MSKKSANGANVPTSVSTAYPMVFRDELPEGTVVIPTRSIGDTSPETPVQYPTKWPKAISDVMKRRGDRPIRLYADGIFDVFHYGHARALEQAKKSFPNAVLLVGCCNDELTHKFKGQTVMTDVERYESLRHCKWVDEVVPDAPWVITDEFLEKHDIDFVCHDALPYVDTSGASSTGDVYAHLKTIGKFHETQRTEGVSTSDLIIRIVKRYDDFVRRNLSRGYSAKEMNVPLWKEKSIQLEMALQKQKASAVDGIKKLSDAAESAHYDFLRLFSRQGPVVNTIVGGIQKITGVLSQISPTRASRATSTTDEEVDVDTTDSFPVAATSGRKRRPEERAATSQAKRKRADSAGSDHV